MLIYILFEFSHHFFLSVFLSFNCFIFINYKTRSRLHCRFVSSVQPVKLISLSSSSNIFVDLFGYPDEPLFWSSAPDCKINPTAKYNLNSKHLYNRLLWYWLTFNNTETIFWILWVKYWHMRHFAIHLINSSVYYINNNLIKKIKLINI